MELDKQVCSLELAKKLRELGVKQESLSVWYDGKRPYIADRAMKGCGRCGAVLNGIKPPRTVAEYAAFTVAELGEMLLKRRDTPTSLGFRTFLTTDGKPTVGYDKERDNTADTEADARAKMLVYLLENNLIV